LAAASGLLEMGSINEKSPVFPRVNDPPLACDELLLLLPNKWNLLVLFCCYVFDEFDYIVIGMSEFLFVFTIWKDPLVFFESIFYSTERDFTL